MKSYFNEFTRKMRETRQRSASLNQDARQSRLAMEEDVTADKTRKRTEGVAAAARVISRGKSSAQVDTNPIRLTGFGYDSTRLLARPYSRDDEG